MRRDALFRPVHTTFFRLSLAGGVLLPLGFAAIGTALGRSPYNTNVGQPIDQQVPFSHKHHAYELGIDCRYCHTSVETSSSAGIPPTQTCMTCHSMIWTNSPLLQPVRDSWTQHKPLVWKRVNDLPKFVFFDHSIHINRGINCDTCHGPVQDMQMTYKGESFQMVWCLKCHQEPEKHLYTVAGEEGKSPREQVFETYWNLQAGKQVSPDEQRIVSGEDLPTVDSIDAGKTLVKTYRVRKAELDDCWTCHR